MGIENKIATNEEISKLIKHRKKNGFTLIELLTVVGVIGVLSAIGIPVYMGARAKAKDSACEALYKPAITELTNELENRGDAASVVARYVVKNKEKRNPWDKQEPAYKEADLSNEAAAASLDYSICQVL